MEGYRAFGGCPGAEEVARRMTQRLPTGPPPYVVGYQLSPPDALLPLGRMTKRLAAALFAPLTSPHSHELAR